MRDNYRLAGHFYEFTTSVSVNRCRVAMLDYLRPGDTVLFAGVGHGSDAIYAAQRGANVTVVDLSKTMLQKFQQHLEEINKKSNTPITVLQVHSDIMKITEYEQYDMVVANFFLNVFHREKMVKILEHLIGLSKPGAKVVIGDFSYPGGNILSRAFQTMFWYGVVTSFWVLAGNAIHNIYNYPEEMKLLGLQIKDKKYFKFLRSNCYWSLLGQKPV